MNKIQERDLYTIENECHYTNIEEVKVQFDYEDFDEEVFEMILWKIFTEQNQKWINHLNKLIYYKKKYNYSDDEVKYFSIYWVKYQEDLMDIYNDVQRCIDLIDEQKDNIESEINDAQSEKDKAESEYYNIANNIESITGDNDVPSIESVSRYTRVDKAWDVDISNIDSGYDEYDISSLLDDMESWKDNYWDNDEIIDDYNELLVIAKENYEKAQEFQGEVEGWMYDY